MTFGAGGHSRAILEAAPNCRLICLDRDPLAYKLAQDLSKEFPDRVQPFLGRFTELPELLKTIKVRFGEIDGFLYDLGCSSMQFDVDERGFSISKDGPLDMRMDGARFPDAPTAADVIKYADEEDLFKIFRAYGEEKHSKKIARAIVEARYSFKSINTTKDLSALVAEVLMAEYRMDSLQRPAHVATKIFQALRIFVNNELNEINNSIHQAYKYLRVGGRLLVISFHSLEDRIVKNHFSGNSLDNTERQNSSLKFCDYSKTFADSENWKIYDGDWAKLVKNPLTPSDEEIKENPRSRSAKLRAGVKLT
ncbi:MraW methylase family [Nesidiocoris tenuis]|uniref:MraW methylase family n=1 Tax=Nesidiocoris tenuis TaxID=355587 RepID=A0ABN7AWW6_9HEMI|nr:MraW methylase family [Nesidiocoris tenuis]